ncbi:MAG: CYTH domain-containing protein [Lachnospiraceae bacterium]
MEIERKFIINEKPQNLEKYPHHKIEQAYLSTNPVVRIRKKDDQYILTYKGRGMMAREEVELPLTKESYEHLLTKADGNIIRKTRYLIPTTNHCTIELDIFEDLFEGLILAEVEFPSIEAANAYQMPHWFAKDVTLDPDYHNSRMSQLKPIQIIAMIAISQRKCN